MKHKFFYANIILITNRSVNLLLAFIINQSLNIYPEIYYILFEILFIKTLFTLIIN